MNKKPKILICIMSCCDSFYLREEELIKNTWLRLCKHFDNIDYIIFRGNANKTQFINKHLVLINCPDDLAGTYDKNYLLFKLLKEQNIEFDYLLRTNCSTFINIKLLNEYLTYVFNNVKQQKILYTESHKLNDVYMISGKFMCFPKKYIDILLDNRIEKFEENEIYFDDYYICKSLQLGINKKLKLSPYELSNYDLLNFKSIPALYLDDPFVRSFLDVDTIDNLFIYDKIASYICICCKPYNENNLQRISENMNHLYKLCIEDKDFINWGFDKEALLRNILNYNVYFYHDNQRNKMVHHFISSMCFIYSDKFNFDDIQQWINKNEYIHLFVIYSKEKINLSNIENGICINISGFDNKEDAMNDSYKRYGHLFRWLFYSDYLYEYDLEIFNILKDVNQYQTLFNREDILLIKGNLHLIDLRYI